MILIKYKNINDFEYDIQGLIRQFFPGEDMATDKDVAADYTLVTDIQSESVSTKLYVKDKPEPVSECEDVIDYSDRKQTKNVLKRVVYNTLSGYTDKKLPWGTLSGIRPTKITSALLAEGNDKEWLRKHMKSEYYVSDKKTELSIDISEYELNLLNNINYKNGHSVYIGIPFCPSICSYCSFSSYPLARYTDKVDKYLDALIKEIDYVSKAFSDRELNTVYIGGGTPTTLEPHQLDRLLGVIREKFDFTNIKEFTVEAGRPDSISADKLRVMMQYGVTRMSINPQTMNQKTLDIIGRRHTVKDITDAFALAREQGFDNINMDFIVGLPQETTEDIKYTLEEAKRLNPDSITIHSLAIKRAARLNTMKEVYSRYSYNNSDEVMDMCAEYAYGMGMKPYYLYRQKNMTGNMENVGYAKPGKAGIYNILIMEEVQPIIACGAGASSKMVFPDGNRIERIENVKDVDCYIERIDDMIKRKESFLQDNKGVF